MKEIMKRFATGLTTLAFAAALAAPALTYANGPDKAPLEIKVRVSEDSSMKRASPMAESECCRSPKIRW